MSTTQTILSNAQHHTDLARVLESLQYAPGALKRQTRHIEQLQKQAEEMKQRIGEMKKATKGKRREYEETSGSVVLRMANTFAGRKEHFIARVQREENEYVNALEAEMQERTRLETLEDTINEAEQMKIDLDWTVDLYQTMQMEVRSLYSRAFDQPSSSKFVQNDEALEHLKTAEETCKSLHAQIKANEDVTKLLKEADNSIRWCLAYIEEGMRCYEDWGTYGNGVLVDMEREFNNAAQAVAKVNSLLSRARKIEPVIQSVPQLEVYESCMSGDIVVKYGVKISNSAAKVKKNKGAITAAQETISSEILSTSLRIQQLKADLEEAEEVKYETELELDRVRRKIWEEIVEDQVGLESSAPSGAEDAVPSRVMRKGLKSIPAMSPPSYESLASTMDEWSEGESSSGHSSVEALPALPTYTLSPRTLLATSCIGRRLAHAVVKV